MKHLYIMKRIKLKVKSLGIAALLIFVISLSPTTAQVSLNAAGGNGSGSGGKVSYSLGQVVYTTNTASTGSVAQGVQQSFEISEVSGMEDVDGISLKISAYPNPTTDYLTLSIKDNIFTSYDSSPMSYQLYDIRGKLLQNDIIISNQTSIVMSNLAPASYFIKVFMAHGDASQKELKTFKIVKIK